MEPGSCGRSWPEEYQVQDFDGLTCRQASTDPKHIALFQGQRRQDPVYLYEEADPSETSIRYDSQ